MTRKEIVDVVLDDGRLIINDSLILLKMKEQIEGLVRG
jgi:hypothetical protein